MAVFFGHSLHGIRYVIGRLTFRRIRASIETGADNPAQENKNILDMKGKNAMVECETPVLSTDFSHPANWSDVGDPDRAAELRIAPALLKKAVVLASSENAVTPPLETPSNAWGLLVDQVQVYLRGAYAGRVELFTGVWLRRSFQLSYRHEGLVVIQVDSPSRLIPHEKSVRVRLLQACVVGRNYTGWNPDSVGWNLVGEWDPVGVDWPRLVAPTALALMNLYGAYSSYRWGE